MKLNGLKMPIPRLDAGKVSKLEVWLHNIIAFILGLLFGPAGILYASSANEWRKRSLYLALFGWVVGWGVIIVIGTGFVSAQREREAIEEAERQAALELRHKQEEAERKEKEAIAEKKARVNGVQQKLLKIRELQERINGILYGEIYSGFDRDDVRRYSADISLRDESLDEKLLSRDVGMESPDDDISVANRILDEKLDCLQGRLSKLRGIYEKFRDDKADAEEAERKRVQELGNRREQREWERMKQERMRSDDRDSLKPDLLSIDTPDSGKSQSDEAWRKVRFPTGIRHKEIKFYNGDPRRLPDDD